MVRKIIKIDEDKCNGCGLCAKACHEGAIGMVDGKARLLRDDYCDGLGDCLPVCPTGAITFEEREAAGFSPQAKMPDSSGNRTGREADPAYDVEAVKANMAPKAPAGGCPGSMARTLGGCPGSKSHAMPAREELADPAQPSQAKAPVNRLAQWPVQIKLAPVNAPWFDGARLLIAADCTAYAYAGFHERFMKNHITLIGCPKLDEGDYAEKLAAILRQNDIKSVTVARMEVPCCGGIENAVKRALAASGKMIPWQVVTISTDGSILDE